MKKMTRSFEIKKIALVIFRQIDASIFSTNTHFIIINHRPQDMTKLECFSCEIVFNSMDHIRKHMKDEHSHECETCGDSFRARCILRKHIIDTHTMQGADHPNKCRLCDDEFLKNEDLQEHIQNIHTYNCETCGYTGIGEETMEDHILEKHAQPDCNGFFRLV